MKITDVEPGMTITNGSSALTVSHREAKNRTWKTSGYAGVNIGIGEFGGDHGYGGFVPDYLIASWRPVPFEWTPVVGGGLVERYVWRGGRLYRQVQRAEALTGGE